MSKQPIIDIQKTPDVFGRTQYVPRSAGKKSKMGICQFWAYLFELNESLPRKHRMTDEEIKRQVIQEFPDRQAVVKLGPVGQKGEVTVNHYRQKYNVGRFTQGMVPKKLSKRYGLDGKEVNPRTGKPLS